MLTNLTEKTMQVKNRKNLIGAMLQLGLRSIFFISVCLLVACGSEIKSVEPTINPNPKEIYDITVTVEGAPGEFLSAEGEQDFEIKDWDCLPPASILSMSGARPVAAYHSKKVVFKKISPTSFMAAITLDKYKPNDDYGLGLCEWYLPTLLAKFYNGSNEHLIILSEVDIKQKISIREAMQLNRFYMKTSPESGLKWLTNSGDRVAEKDEIKYPLDKYFYIVIKTQKRVE